MADKDFVVKNGLVVNTNALVVNGSNVGISTTTPDAALTVSGTANLQGNVAFTGSEITTTANVTFFGNVHTKNNVFIDKKLYVGNTETMVQDLPTIIQAVDNFNGFVMVSSQNLSQLDDACADLLIYADNTNGLSNFNDLGINNSRFDGRIHRIVVNSTASAWQLGETVFQRNGAGANIAVGQIRDITTVNSSAISLKIRVSEDDGLATYVGMANFTNTAGSNLSLRAATSAANADVLAAVAFFSLEANTISRRNYAFTVGKRGDGYLYNANSALTIGTTAGGIRSTTVTVPTSFSSGVNTIVVSSGNSTNDRLIANSVTLDMNVTGTGIDTDTYVTSMVNSTAFRISKSTTGTGSGTITLRDEFYDLTEANNPIIFHVGGMMAKDEIARFSGTGNFTIGPPTTSRSSKLTVNGTANLAGVTNVGANLNVVGNVYSPGGIFSSSVNVGSIAISTYAIDVGANVNLDTTGLKISGNTLIPSMNVSGGNITIGNNSISNTPTIRVVNSSFSANITPSGLSAGIIAMSANSSNGSINVGSNVFINTSAISVGNTLSNVVLNMNEPDYKLKIQGGAYVNGVVVITSNLVVQGTMTYAGNTVANADFIPATNNAFDLGNSSSIWKVNYVREVVIPTDGIITAGNSTVNTTMRTNSLRVSNSSTFSNVSLDGVALGNTTVNTQLTSSSMRIGNTTSNSVVNSSAIVIGNTSVNSTVNSSAFVGNVFSVFANATTVNTTTLNSTTANAVSVNASANVRVGANVTLNTGALAFVNSSATTVVDGTSISVGNSSVVGISQIRVQNTAGATVINSNFVSTTSLSGNLTGNVAATTITGNLTGNVAATTISGNLTGNVAATTITGNLTGNVIATTVNATTMNAATFQVGASSFKANSTDVLTSNLTVTGNMTVTGSVVSMNTSNFEVTGVDITVAKGVATVGAANGAGIIVDTANVSLLYSSDSGNWVSNTGISVGNSTVNVTTNSSSFSGNTIGIHFGNVQSVTTNATTMNSARFQVGSTFSANSTVVNSVAYNVGTRVIANSTVTNATHLNGELPSYYLDATNLSGTIPYVNIPANVVNTTAAFTRTGITTFGANVILGSSGLSANGGYGTAGQLLTSNGTATYWSDVSAGSGGTVTSVANGVGLSGGTITGSGTLSVTQGTGVVVNATGVHVNANYIGTLTSNSALNLGSFAASLYYRSGGTDVSMGDGGTSSSLTASAGAVVYSNTTGMALTAVGTAGQVLTSNGVNAPYWRDASADTFPSGTRLLFQQSTAPTGWTKDVSQNDKAIRIVSGSVVGGGSVAFSTAFTNRTVSGTTVSAASGGTISTRTITGTTGSTILTVSQIPSHRHFLINQDSTSTGSPTVATADYIAQYNSTNGNATYGLNGTATVASAGRSSNTGGEQGHDHTFDASHNHTISGTDHTHTYSSTLNMAVAYVDVIIAQKN